MPADNAERGRAGGSKGLTARIITTRAIRIRPRRGPRNIWLSRAGRAITPARRGRARARTSCHTVVGGREDATGKVSHILLLGVGENVNLQGLRDVISHGGDQLPYFNVVAQVQNEI